MNPSRNILATFGINGSLRKREVQAQASYTEYYLSITRASWRNDAALLWKTDFFHYAAGLRYDPNNL